MFCKLPRPTVTEFFLRTSSVVILTLQAVILDWYLVHYGGNIHAFGWIAADIVVIGIFLLSYVYADLYFKQNQIKQNSGNKAPRRHRRRRKKEETRTDDPNEPKSEISDDHDSTRISLHPFTDAEFDDRENGDASTDELDGSAPPDAVDWEYKYEPTMAELFEEAEKSDEEDADNQKRTAVAEVNRLDADNHSKTSTASSISIFPDVAEAYHTLQGQLKVRDDKIISGLSVGRIRRKYKLGALPLAYISWAVYAGVLIAKMQVILVTFGSTLNPNMLFGSNMLELAFVSTAGVFAFVVSGHKRIPRHQKGQKTVIDYMKGRVLMDIIDSVELLEYVYEAGSKEAAHNNIGPALKITILVLISIQIFLPSVGLYQLSATNFAHKNPPMIWTMIHQMLNLFLENAPYLIIRIYMWANNLFTESTFVFIAKNIFEITMNDWDFIVWLRIWIYSKFFRKN
ncbi:uncharacterized protein LOC129587252 [Paramacrobiotus metropolitanus]|uniref:uncharacterized protein LOC129587252 n=1 Tax=Paramacrobiotus metropolitanus TaxID=2943436 RepID=UPI002446262B|nr:uncharacterized protein LOC129587252 [Paramacrobiotus metropolitanus]